jgi:hypothetical protein
LSKNNNRTFLSRHLTKGDQLKSFSLNDFSDSIFYQNKNNIKRYTEKFYMIYRNLYLIHNKEKNKSSQVSLYKTLFKNENLKNSSLISDQLGFDQSIFGL